MITITQKITPENHWLLFMAAESQRKSEDGEDEVIFVNGDIYFYKYKGPIYLPNNLKVGGDLNLTDCTGLIKLPDNLEVGEWLNLTDCTGLTKLPDNLKVNGWLNLSGCTGLIKLPDNLKVAGSIFEAPDIVKKNSPKFKDKFVY